MRQQHKGGEKLFVDYAGLTVPIVSKETGATAPAQIFVAVLGASNYTYADASWTQGSVDFYWLAGQGIPVLRRSTGNAGAGQPAQRCHQSLSL